MIFKFLFPSFLLFVNDGLFILQEKSCLKLNADLFSSYNIISSLFNQFRLVIKHNKSEFFHFSRATKNYNPQLLDLSPLGGSLPIPKNVIAQGCGQTLGLGLEQSKDIVIVFY